MVRRRRARAESRARLIRRAAIAVVALVATAVPDASLLGSIEPLSSDLRLVVRGGGWGHGHGMSQYGARAQAEDGRSWRQILGSYYSDVDIGDRSHGRLRVLIDSAGKVTVGGNERHRIKWAGGDWIRTSSADWPYTRVRPTTEGRVRVYKGRSQDGPWDRIATGTGRIRFYPEGTSIVPVLFAGRWNYYRGSVEAYRRSDTRIHAINRPTMDDYLYGSVGREMPAAWHIQALRAQAVAARSYAGWKKANAPSGASYHICATTSCQVYRGYGYRSSEDGTMHRLESSRVRDAVDDTSAKTMLFNGYSIFAEYHSSSGGHTSQGSRAYLAPRSDAWDGEYSPHHRWTGSVGVAEIERRWPQVGRLARIDEIVRDGDGPWGGRVTSMRLVGTEGTARISGNTFRSAFSWGSSSRPSGLRSSLFTIDLYDHELVDAPTVLVAPGAIAVARLRVRNTGTVAWPVGGSVRLGTWNPKDHASRFATDTWSSPSRPSWVTANVSDPGSTRVARDQVAEFRFQVHAAPDLAQGLHSEFFRPLVSGLTWFGPSLTLPIRVSDAAADGSGTVDVDGDGRSELVVGVPGDEVGGDRAAGAATVLFGSGAGLRATGSERWHLDIPGVQGRSAARERYGTTTALGDFDGDGRDDLAVGIPGADGGRGAVSVLYGSSSGVTSRDQYRHLNTAGVKGSAAAGDRFGAALAAGDFDGDGRDDLAVGIPGKRSDRGMLSVQFGSASGLSARDLLIDSADLGGTPEIGDRFASVLTAADFDGDGRADLAIGSPLEDHAVGAVHVAYGSHGGVGGRNRVLQVSSSGIKGRPASGDRFGASLAGGDFDGDGRDDLAVGIPGARSGRGAVTIVYGARGGLAERDQRRSLDSTGIKGRSAAEDRYGSSLAGGDFDGDGRDDLAVGIPGRRSSRGAVSVNFGGRGGFTDRDQYRWLDSAGIKGRSAAGDRYASALAAGDLDGDGRDDLAVGIPGKRLGRGAVSAMYGARGGLSDRDQYLHLDTSGVPGTADPGDRFGAALTSG